MKIHERLEADSLFIKDLELSQLRMIKDGDNPWFLLIPRKEGLVDWSDLSREDQHLLTDEIDFVCKKIQQKIEPDKLNVASLGNMVPQLHIHIIARFKTDRAWPGPIWGSDSISEFTEKLFQEWLVEF